MSFDDAKAITAVGAPSLATFSGPWRTVEVEALKRLYPLGGSDGVRAEIPHRSLAAIRSKANSLGLECCKPSTAGKILPRKYDRRDDIDQAIREGYIHANAKGDIKALAGRIGRPAWWVQKRATALGVTRNNRTRLDCWSAQELAIVEQWAMCDAKIISTKLRKAGFDRTPNAIVIKIKREKFDRENPDRWTATAVAPLLGVNPRTVADWIERRGLPATHEAWGPNGRFMIDRKALRGWIKLHSQWIDLRRVDQPWFKDLMFGAA